MKDIPALYGSMVFNDSVMKEMLPKETYLSLKRTTASGKTLEADIANTVADAMKKWAVSKGATHFTHWFQPMTGVTAEKHDSFIMPTDGGHAMMAFSGKELVSSEPDASSFPSGGLRATFEARGYTAWDPTSYAFIKGDTLCIPTAFCSYGGESLDEKTPLLRSMEALEKQALRILRLFGDGETKRVVPTVGAEQEYFLIDKRVFDRRLDLLLCGRTLFGAKPPKGQEMDDHYSCAIMPRVSAFMKEVDEELWKLGVPVKTEHNESAPAQHELVPIFTSSNVAADHNQLCMELLKSIADRHGMACLLHEKPFAGVNGSGKHNNWSLSTDGGKNLLEPGDTPSQNAQFMLILAAFMKAVDENQDLLRLASASAGNDHRLGGNEAPPAIVSLYLGEEITEILDAIENDVMHEDMCKTQLEIGVSVLPRIPKDTTDRNRTSPIAFTGNKFEFRMLGSSFSVSWINAVINTVMADVLEGFADELESARDFTLSLNKLIRRTISEHKRIIFNGNGYTEEWVEEAARRGLLNLACTVDAAPRLIDEKNLRLFTKHSVYSENELRSRYEILLENYCKTVNIDGLTLLDMVTRQVLPASFAYERELAETLNAKAASGGAAAAERALLSELSAASDSLYALSTRLEQLLTNGHGGSVLSHARYYRDSVLPVMADMRSIIDVMEKRVKKDIWPFPTYSDMLYSVR